MAEYAKALENEIVIEMTVQDIANGARKVFKFIGDLIRRAIEFLANLIKKLGKIKKTDKDPTPTNMDGAGAEVMKKEAPKVVTVKDVYDCGNELNGIVADIDLCINLLAKRPTPNSKANKHYDERWAGDNEIIAERMTRCNDNLTKLEEIEYKSLTVETAEELKKRLETLNGTYQKYARIYDMFIKKNPHMDQYMVATQTSFNTIASVSSKTLQIVLQLYGPAE